ncbi:MAG: hypothetical protein H0W90_08870 [Actinobacteria bacterium]|nr:hypothetical protein [Actinomycetota bacterium]
MATQFSAPAHLKDLSAEGRRAWSEQLSNVMDQAIEGSGNPADSPRPQFFNPAKASIAADHVEKGIFWTASPRKLLFVTSVVRRRWEIADGSRERQDEYCEWAVQRDEHGKVTRVTFTCEVPEYFELLAKDNKKRLLELYRDFASPQVQPEDLFDSNGEYAPKNRWNNKTAVGPVHLTQRNNNLGAAIELAAAATIIRKINGRILTSEQELIRCSQYGDPDRNSDPHIGAQVNLLARSKADITLADPPGLYINDFTPAGFKTPDGTDARSFWNITRGEPGRGLRGVFEVPSGKGYAVGDITIGGAHIEFGAQVADFVSIRLVGLACRLGKSTVEPKTGCV